MNHQLISQTLASLRDGVRIIVDGRLTISTQMDPANIIHMSLWTLIIQLCFLAFINIFSFPCHSSQVMSFRKPEKVTNGAIHVRMHVFSLPRRLWRTISNESSSLSCSDSPHLRSHSRKSSTLCKNLFQPLKYLCFTLLPAERRRV